MGPLNDQECMNEIWMYSSSSWVENKYGEARDRLCSNRLFALRKDLSL